MQYRKLPGNLASVGISQGWNPTTVLKDIWWKMKNSEAILPQGIDLCQLSDRLLWIGKCLFSFIVYSPIRNEIAKGFWHMWNKKLQEVTLLHGFWLFLIFYPFVCVQCAAQFYKCMVNICVLLLLFLKQAHCFYWSWIVSILFHYDKVE